MVGSRVAMKCAIEVPKLSLRAQFLLKMIITNKNTTEVIKIPVTNCIGS